MWGIYKLEFPNGKCYIGQSCNLKRRLKDYDHWEKRCTAQTALYGAFKKHGAPTKTIIFQDGGKLDQKKLDDLEIQYIQEFNSLVPNGYNIEKGGHGNAGKTHSCSSRYTKEISKLILGTYYNEPIINIETKEYYSNCEELFNKVKLASDCAYSICGVDNTRDYPYHFTNEDYLEYAWGDCIGERPSIGEVRKFHDKEYIIPENLVQKEYKHWYCFSDEYN